jgi:hypothetical protein
MNLIQNVQRPRNKPTVLAFEPIQGEASILRPNTFAVPFFFLSESVCRYGACLAKGKTQ